MKALRNIMLLLIAAVLPAKAATDIPLTVGNYLTTSESATTGTINNNDGGNLGGIYKDATATFTLTNAEAQEMVLSFLTGNNNSSNPQVTVTLNDGSSDIFTKTISVENTGGWNPSSKHIMNVGTVPAGTVTLTFSFTNSSSYVCNLGSIGLYNKSAYLSQIDVIPGTITLSSGIYNGPKVEGAGNVGYVQNGGKASYAFYNDTEGAFDLTLDIYRYNQGGTMNVKIVDLATGEEDYNDNYVIANDAPASYTENTISIPSITTGYKTMTFSFSNGSSYICNYKNVAFAYKGESPEPPVVVIEDVALTSVSVNGTALNIVSTINNSENSYTATYSGCYTTIPTVTAIQNDDDAANVSEPVINGTTYTYTIAAAIKDTEMARNYTLVLDNVHIYTPTGSEETVDIKNNEGTRENGIWTNGVYTLSTSSLDGYNQYFKMNGNDYTISLPADVVVKQLILKEASNNYAGNDARILSVSSTGATTYIPVDNKFFHESEGSKHDIVINIEGHTAGTDISFNQPKSGQPMAWIQLVTVTANPGTAPVKTAEEVSVVRNHAVVTLTFDREIPNDVNATINGQTVTAEGGSAVLVFPVWGLSYSTNYTMTIAAGAVVDTYDNTNTEAINVAINTEAKPAVAAAAYDYVVSNATELDAALAELKESNKTAEASRKTVFLKNGNYTYGTLEGSYQNNVSLKIDNWNNVYNVSLIGESKDGVIIEGTTDGITSSTLNLGNGTGVYVQDMTIRNNYDFHSGSFKGVSVAVSGGNKAVLKNVAMQACQDTYVTGKRTYLENCDIWGTVDFICGGGDIFFNQCDLILVDRGGDVIVAPNTTSDTQWGYVFQYCTIKAEDGATAVTDKGWDLGRPWQNEPRSYFLNTTMNVLPSDNGWKGMSTLPTHFYEYNSMDADGNALDLSVRGNSPTSTNNYTPVLSGEEAARFTVENVLGGTDSWLPTELTAQVATPTATINEGALSWTAVDDARCYVVFKDGDYYANLTANTLALTEAGLYTVCAANEMGGLGERSNSVRLNATVTTGTLGWATACLTYDAQVPVGTKAYYISSVSADAVTLTELTEIPAGEGFIFNAAEGEHDFSALASPLSPLDGNLLVGTIASTPVDANSVYVLGKNSDSKAALMRYTGTSVAAGKAYLPASSVPSGSRSLRIVFDGEATAITSFTEVQPQPTANLYDLQGRCAVNAEANSSLFTIHSSLKRGIYIKDGKKIIK